MWADSTCRSSCASFLLPWEKQCHGERYFGLQFRGFSPWSADCSAFWWGRNIIEGSCSKGNLFTSWQKEAERENRTKEERAGDETQPPKASPCNLLPSSRPHLLSFHCLPTMPSNYRQSRVDSWWSQSPHGLSSSQSPTSELFCPWDQTFSTSELREHFRPKP